MIRFCRRFHPLAVIAILSITLASLAPAQPTTAGVEKSGRVLTTHLQTGLFGGLALEQQAPLFLPAVMYDSDWSGEGSIAVADVNGDGKADMVVAAVELSSGNGVVDVLLGNGDGTFRPAVGQSSGGRYTSSVAVADVNGDGKPDILVANFCTTTCTDPSGVVGVLLGNGDGTFQPVVTYGSGGGYSLSIAVADVNGDGKPDVLVANEITSGLSVLLGNGDGTFKSAVTCDAGLYLVRSVQVADLNGDGRPDLAITASDYAGVIGVLLGNGDGTFQPTVTYRTAGYDSGLVRVSDVNGDHKPDLVTMLCISGTNDCSTSQVGVLMGNGDGTFQPAVTSPASGYYVGLSAATDFNGDGKPDVLIFNRADEGGGSGALGVMQGNGDGTFQLPVLYSAGLPLSPGAADVNGDGKPDALVMSGCSGHGCVGAMLNNAGAFRPTTTALLTSLNPSVFGQTITFMATVSSPSGAPTGIVELLDGSTSLGSVTLVNGTASIAVSSLAAGSHSITAWYPLSANFGGSTSTPIIQVVNTAVTQTTLVSSVNPVGVRQYVEYTASIASQYGGTATGEVTFQDAGWIVRVKVAGNQAKFKTYYTSKENGAHSILATYPGDISNIGSTAPPLIEYVGDFPVSSKVQVTTSGSPSLVGQPVTFATSVTPAGAKYGAIPDGELVWFYDGTTVLGSVALVGGRAEYTTAALPAGTHRINATYPGDSIFKPAADAITQIVNKNATTTTLHSNPNPSAHGQAVTFTAKVRSPGQAPTGKVKFMDGTTAIGSATLSGGVAKLVKSNLAGGTHSITAQYLGDAVSTQSTSSVLDQEVR